jgi:hypothetical protein
MSRVKVTYVAIDVDGFKPIMTASTLDELKGGLDDYYAVGKGEAECWGFYPIESKYPDLYDYQGYFTYAWKNVIRGEVTVEEDKVKVYCTEYYPYTTYEKIKINGGDI